VSTDTERTSWHEHHPATIRRATTGRPLAGCASGWFSGPARRQARPAELLSRSPSTAGLLQLLRLDLLLDLHLHRDALVELGANDLAPGIGLRDGELLARVREADAPLGFEELALLAFLFEGVGGLSS
jgi:hypothetical protein